MTSFCRRQTAPRPQRAPTSAFAWLTLALPERSPHGGPTEAWLKGTGSWTAEPAGHTQCSPGWQCRCRCRREGPERRAASRPGPTGTGPLQWHLLLPKDTRGSGQTIRPLGSREKDSGVLGVSQNKHV